MSCNMAGISYIVTPFHCLRMPNTFTRCFCYAMLFRTFLSFSKRGLFDFFHFLITLVASFE